MTSDACRLFIDLSRQDGMPTRGDYLVTVGRRGVGSAYQILSARQVRRRDPAAPRRISLACLRAPDVLPRVRITPGGHVVLPGETVWWGRWYSRIRKGETWPKAPK